MTYRTISAIELREGDEYSSTNPTHGAFGRWNLVFGNLSRYAEYDWGIYRRPIREDNWIAFSDRKPTKEDAGEQGHIVVLYCGDDGSTSELLKQQFCEDSSGYWSADYWMPLNFVSREPVRVKVDGHEVVPNKDGSVKVGCQTVSSQDFEEIARQRSEAMK
jgi:hypothetical protein